MEPYITTPSYKQCVLLDIHKHFSIDIDWCLVNASEHKIIVFLKVGIFMMNLTKKIMPKSIM